MKNLVLTDLTYTDDFALIGGNAEAAQDPFNSADQYAKMVD